MRYRIVPEDSRLSATARSSLHPIKVESEVQGGFELELVADELDLARPPRGGIELQAAALRSGNSLYDSELTRRLEVVRYPTIVGTLQSVSKGRVRGRYVVRGTVAFHGVSRVLQGEVQLREFEGGALLFEGETVIDMRQFALSPPRILMLRVYPEVQVQLRLVARPELVPERQQSEDRR